MGVHCITHTASPPVGTAHERQATAWQNLEKWVVDEHGGMAGASDTATLAAHDAAPYTCCCCSRHPALLPPYPPTQTNAVLGTDPAAGELRGLYATSFIPQHGTILSIPHSAILNVGGHTDFGGPTLHLLRELHSPGTRFKPYLDILPSQGEAVSGCNLPPSYIPMLQSPFWESTVTRWQEELARVWEGRVDATYSFILREAIGTESITFEHLQHVCALASSRYITGDPRPVGIMVPIFDMINHARNCTNYIASYELLDGFFQLKAGMDIQEGQQVCYHYGDLRDDYALVHYGFTVGGEAGVAGPLCSVDHPDFVDGREELPTSQFSG
ncbi:MAG: hypothetical protein WDW36_000481 [Sanguina aurantia]